MLKRREAAGEPTDWVMYGRKARMAPKLVRFEVMTADEGRLRFGEMPMPAWMAIEKRREVWIKDNVTVSIDEVEELGRYVKIESLVSVGRNVIRVHEEIAAVRRAIMPALGEPIAEGYGELLARQMAG